jgi:uncharacterized membrane protein
MVTHRLLILLVHITAAAFLFGGSAGVARPVRRSLELGTKAMLSAAEDLVRRGKMIGMSSMMTLVTGVVLLATRAEGFGKSPKNYHAALGLMLGAVLLSVLLIRPAASGILAEARKEAPSTGAITALLKRLAMGQGIMHLLWVVVLVLMLVRF